MLFYTLKQLPKVPTQWFPLYLLDPPVPVLIGPTTPSASSRKAIFLKTLSCGSYFSSPLAVRSRRLGNVLLTPPVWFPIPCCDILCSFEWWNYWLHICRQLHWGSGEALAEDDCCFSLYSLVGATKMLCRYQGVGPCTQQTGNAQEGLWNMADQEFPSMTHSNLPFIWVLASRTVTLDIGI